MKKRIGIGICLLLFINGISQYILEKKEWKQVESVGEIVDLDHYQAAYYKQGSGEANIVMIAGSGTPCAYTDFYNLQEHLSTTYTTLSFDQAGTGFSTQTNEARTIENLVEELHQLITTTLPDQPTILVAHSLGGLQAISYAQSYPENIIGIIFLDSGTPNSYATDSIVLSKALNYISSLARITGIPRLLSNIDWYLPVYGQSQRNALLDKEVKELDTMMYNHYLGNANTRKGIDYMNQNGKNVTSKGDLGNLPILVLSSDSGKEWQKVQEELANYSTNSKQVTIPNSIHYLHHSSLKEVEEAIDTFLNTL